MATTTPNFGWTVPTSTDLVKNGATAIETLGDGIDASFVDLKGGTTGQILAKASNTDLDYAWIANDQGDITEITASSPLTGGGTTGAVTVGILDGTTSNKGAVQLSTSTSSTSTSLAATASAVKSAYDLAAAAIPKSTVTTAGDVIYATGSSAVTRLGIGSAGQVLTVASGVPSWATPSAASSFVGAYAYITSNGYDIANSTYTDVTFDGERFDTDGFHSTSVNTNRMTVPSGKAGYYNIIGCLTYDGSGTGSRQLILAINGSRTNTYSQWHEMGGVSTGPVTLYINIIANLAVGDYFGLQTRQNSGGNLYAWGWNFGGVAGGGAGSTILQCQYLGA